MNVAVIDPTTPHAVRLTVRDFLLLDEHGAFDGYAKSELLDGEVFCVNAQHNPHAMAKSDLLFALMVALRKLRSPYRATAEASVELDGYNLPEPDIAVTTYRGKHVVPGASVALVVEVSDTTLRHDLTRKAPLYAAAGVPEYWVLDVQGQELHQLWDPATGAYRQRRVVRSDGPIAAVTIAGLAISLAE